MNWWAQGAYEALNIFVIYLLNLEWCVSQYDGMTSMMMIQTTINMTLTLGQCCFITKIYTTLNFIITIRQRYFYQYFPVQKIIFEN